MTPALSLYWPPASHWPTLHETLVKNAVTPAPVAVSEGRVGVCALHVPLLLVNTSAVVAPEETLGAYSPTATQDAGAAHETAASEAF